MVTWQSNFVSLHVSKPSNGPLQAKGITIRKDDTRRMEEEAIPPAICSSWGTTYLMAVGVAMEGCVILCEMSIPCSLCSQFFLNGVQTLHSWRPSFV